MTESNATPPTPAYSAPQSPDRKGKSIAALILGIVSILTSLFWLLSVPVGLVGLVLGILARRSEPTGRKLALWGIITSIVGILLSIVIVVIALAFVGAINNGDITIPSPS